MKKLLLLAATIGSFTIATNAQRNCNVSVTLDAPINNSTLNCVDSFPLKYSMTNNGPDTIFSTDTFYIQDPEISQIDGAWVFSLNADLPPNNSVVLWDSFSKISLTNFLFDDNSEVVEGPFGDGNYKYFVFFAGFKDTLTVNDDDDSDDIDVVDITIDCTSSIFENNRLAASPLNVYPNPATSEFSFKYNFVNNSTVPTLRITDFTGRIVKVQELGKQVIGEKQFTIDITSFVSGVYYVELITDHTRAINKITVVTQ